MPPKKKKSTPIVVGTVSTRSTRRESIVNIEIIPKANKQTKSITRKIPRKAFKTPNAKSELGELGLVQSPEGTRPEILEILKDWSDDESSQDEGIFAGHHTSNSSSLLADDKQSLIDILEGNQSEAQDVSIQKPNLKSNTSVHPKKSSKGKDMLIENPIVNIGSPKGEEPEIIEECIVEDDNIIIVLPEEQTGVCVNREISSNVRDKIIKGSIDNHQDILCLGSARSSSVSTVRQNFKDACEADEDFRSMTSEDTTSQSMLTVQDEYVSDNNDLHISDNSTCNYEIVEEQVVCDSSEPMIIENLDTVLTDNSEGPEHTKTDAAYILTKNEGFAIKEKYMVSRNDCEFSDENSIEVVTEVPDIMVETELSSNGNDDEINSSRSVSTLEFNDNSETKNSVPIHVKNKDKKSKIQSVESDENTLCQKISESMQISQESTKNPFIDITSEKLQVGISKMSITSEEENFAESVVASTKYQRKKTRWSTDNTQSEEKISLNKIKRSSPLTNKAIKKLFDSDSDVSPKISPRASPKSKILNKTVTEFDSKHIRRSSRKKVVDHEIHPENILRDDSNETPASDKCKTVENKADPEGKNIQNENNNEMALINSELNSCKVIEPTLIKEEAGGSKINKAKSKKGQQKCALDGNKMDIDSESSETKTSETEGDSTSNESNQDLVSTKSLKSRRKVSANLLLHGSPTLSDISMSMSEKETDISVVEVYGNKKYPKGNKSKIKKEYRKEVDEGSKKMDTSSAHPITMLRSEIDATIDEVLRKFTYKESDSGKDYDILKDISKDNKTKSSKDFKKKRDTKGKKDEKNGESSEEVRRSDRIKTILPVKKKSHGLVRSKSEPLLSVDAENSDSSLNHHDSDKPMLCASPHISKTEKTKSKSRSSEQLQLVNLSPPDSSPELPKLIDIKADKTGQAEITARLKTFVHLKENQYKTDRQICKEAKDMVCDCYLAEEDIQNNEYGCGEDCLNRLLMIECGELCQVCDRCTNKRFQKSLFAPVEVFKTEKKGLGLRAAANIAYGEFVLEYIGEVLNPDEFDKRAEVYSKDKNIHFYFMSLRADAIIDATMKGNISRFINHSCDPNAETQKWTVNGELRIGFFSTRTILAGEEITFDYRFQRYGKEAQKCYCEATTCRGWLGERPDESEDEEEEEEEESSKIPIESVKAELKESPKILEKPSTGENILEKTSLEEGTVLEDIPVPGGAATVLEIQETPKKIIKKKSRKEMLYDDFDQLNEDIEMLVTTGLKNQAHTLKLSRLMVRAKDLEQRKKLLRVLRRAELPCRRLFLDYHGLRLMHGYMIDAQQLTSGDAKVVSSKLEVIQTKLELLQTLAVLPIQNKTMLIESKVLPTVEKWSKNEDIVEDNDQKDFKKSPEDTSKRDIVDPEAKEKIDETKFLASKLLEEWVHLKESFRIPKKQRIEQMKEHEKEANRKFMESSYAQEKESSRKHDHRYRTWSRYKSERETSKKNPRHEDKDRPSAEYLKISKHERRKLFALQMELKEEERRLKQREMWRQHEMNCMMIGADPRFTAPFDPSKGFQYIWNPSLGQWQALPVPAAQNQGIYNSPVTPQGVSNYNVPPSHKQPLLGPYATPMINLPGLSGTVPQYPGLQPTLPPMVPGITTSTMANPVGGMATSLPVISSNVPGMPGPVHGLSGPITGIAGSLPGITQPPLPALPIYQEVKQDDPYQVKFAGPIPPPAKLPPKWKCAKDKYGRPYYYHVKIRKSQWEPPPLPEPVEESSESSSSETSSASSSDSSSDSETDDEIDDAKLLLEVRKQMENTPKLKSIIPDHIKKEGRDSATPSPNMKVESDNEEEVNILVKEESKSEHMSSIDIRLKEQFNWDSNDPPRKKRRTGLCQEIIISPRTEEDRKQFKEDLKRYKATKEKLKRQKEQMLQQAKKKLKTSCSTEDIIRRPKDLKRLSKSTVKSRIKGMKEWNDEHAKKIKEVFRSTMATTVVGVLNAYRKPDCKEARISNTEDFKHLARKLTHFVMLKEMKHLSCIEELVCTDNVKAKAREYIRKYMSKFGEVYQKRQDEPDFKD